MSSVDRYGVQKEDQEKSKIQIEIETVEVEKVRGERRVCLRGYNKCDANEDWRYVAVRRKRELFRIWKESWNEDDRKKYCETKKY